MAIDAKPGGAFDVVGAGVTLRPVREDLASVERWRETWHEKVNRDNSRNEERYNANDNFAQHYKRSRLCALAGRRPPARERIRLNINLTMLQRERPPTGLRAKESVRNGPFPTPLTLHR
jgi:hypothetical protein